MHRRTIGNAAITRVPAKPLEERLARLLATIPIELQRDGLSLASVQASLRGRWRGNCHPGERAFREKQKRSAAGESDHPIRRLTSPPTSNPIQIATAPKSVSIFTANHAQPDTSKGKIMASVDVVIPCYQYGRFLRDCVTSILEQGIDALCVLIIDNASTDDSVAVAQQLAAEDRRIEVVARVRNLGHHASFNQGVDWAKADYFAIVCADDLLTPGSFMRAVSFMEQHPEVGFTIGKEIAFHQGEALPGIALSEEAHWRIFSGPEFVADRCRKLFAGPIVVRTAVQKQAGHYLEALYFTCDIEMLLRLATFSSVGETTAPQGYRRLHRANLANVHQIDRARDLHEFEAAFVSFFENEGGSLARELRLDRLARRNLVESAYWWGIRDLTKGWWQTGIKLLRFALARSPQLLILPPIGFLFEKDRPLHRLAHVARGTVRSRREVPKSS